MDICALLFVAVMGYEAEEHTFLGKWTKLGNPWFVKICVCLFLHCARCSPSLRSVKFEEEKTLTGLHQ